jgi:hypothetical protein
MPTTPKKAPAKKNGATPKRVSRAAAEKAVAEIKNGPQHSDFRGIRLTLPPTLPASFAFDALEIEEAGGMELKDIRRLLVGLLGEDQWRTIREKITADGDPIDDVGKIMEELLDAMLSPYGVSLGEPQASDAS